MSVQKLAFTDESIQDYEQVKEFLVPLLISSKKNKETMKNRPYAGLGDMRLAYYVSKTISTMEMRLLPVFDQHLKEWGINSDDLEEQAMSNLNTKAGAVLHRMDDVLNIKGASCIIQI